MAVCRARFKFKGDLSADLKILLKRRGFIHFSGHPDWNIYVKVLTEGNTPGPRVVAKTFHDLSDDKQTELNRLCNGIVDQFKGDLTKNKFQIRVRVTNLAKTLEPIERAWMMDWIKRIVDEEDEVENH